MITVTAHSGGIQIRGHAYYAPEGYDIICAAMSTLTITLIESLKQLTDTKFKYDISPGWVDINFEEFPESARVLTDSFFIGIGEIISEYPDKVKLYRNDLGNEQAGAEREEK